MSDEFTEFAEDIRQEAARVERTMTASEIFQEGFKLGLSKAGLMENAQTAWLEWLLKRCL